MSEYTYRPVLCLVQVAAGGEVAVIDALSISDLTPFWEVLAEPGHETVVHAGRDEVEFCILATARPPAGLFDVQIAAGLVGLEYPAGYGTLVSRLLGEPVQQHETRTDWRRRPLTRRQIQYALEDARYLPPLRNVLRERLQQLGRPSWLEEEMATWREGIQRAISQDRWRRVSGNSGLDARALAIVREIWRWREGEAQRRDRPVRRVLRDDLIIELARRGMADIKRIRAIRGLDRGDLRRCLGQIAACIQRALDLPEDQFPKTGHRERAPRRSVLGQFLFSALGSICRQSRLAANLVGGPNDIRDLIAYRLAKDSRREQEPPRLARGWRAEFVGRLFDDLLAGKVAIRIADPAADHPLVFEPGPAQKPDASDG